MNITGYMSYNSKDFILYLFSLLIFAAFSTYAITDHWLLYIIYIALSYMLVFFIAKHGININQESIVLFFKEIIFYPVVFVKEIKPFLPSLYPIYLSYIFAILIEFISSSKIESSFWSHPFPYLMLFYIHFGILTLFRTLILFAHFKKYRLVNDILMMSTWKDQINKFDIRFSIIHSYITGLLTHLSLLLPPLLFWRLTNPSYFREVLLIVFYLILQFINIIINYYKKNYHLPGATFPKWYEINHENSHCSRFYFTLFHGHHHDAIPSSLLADAGVGLLEGMHRSTIRLWFLESITIFLLLRQFYTVFIDIILHQYIPGIFPYSKIAIKGRSHHAVHHYGSLLPFSLGSWPEIADDLKKGYDVNNPTAQWFVKSAVKHENLDPKLAKDFLTTPNAQDYKKVPLVISCLFIMFFFST